MLLTCQVGDKRAAQDVYQFLLGFLRIYPQFVDRPFYLSGESYGGHYIPTEALAILQGNAQGTNLHINLKGFLVGNAWTVTELDNTGAVDFWYSRTMIDTDTHAGILATCNMSDVGPLAAQAKTVRLVSDWEISAGLDVANAARPLGFSPLRDAKTGGPVMRNGDDCDAYTSRAFSMLGNTNIYVRMCCDGSHA